MNEIEQKMSAILDSIPVKYDAQLEVGEKEYSAKCRSKYPCSYQDEPNYDEEDEWRRCLRSEDSECEWRIDSEVYPQFILDFGIFIDATDSAIDIEVDGFWFHKATPEQIASDIRRDAALKQLGWTILRFRADEVHNKPGSVAKRVKDTISSLQPKTIQLL